jgi:hypothetical protein
VEILDPTVKVTEKRMVYVSRPLSLEGKRIGLIENTKFNSDRLLLKIGDILKRDYGATETRIWRKRNSSVPAHEEIIEELRGSCDVMVAGVGD